MLDTLGIVHVAQASTENIARQLAGKSLIHQTVRRVTDSMRLDDFERYVLQHLLHSYE